MSNVKLEKVHSPKFILTIEMNENEARLLKGLVGSLNNGGDFDDENSPRNFTNKIWGILESNGVRNHHHFETRSLPDSF